MERIKQEKKYEIDYNNKQALIKYLEQKPYYEVVQGINMLNSLKEIEQKD